MSRKTRNLKDIKVHQKSPAKNCNQEKKHTSAIIVSNFIRAPINSQTKLCVS